MANLKSDTKQKNRGNDADSEKLNARPTETDHQNRNCDQGKTD